MAQVTMLNGFGECNTKPEILRYRKFVDTQAIISWGNVPTKEFLDKYNIPYAPAFDDKSETSAYVVKTPSGLVNVPTVITKEQAAQLATAMTAAPTAETEAKDVAKEVVDKVAKAAKKFNWWWLAIGGAAWLLLTGSDQNEVKSGLNGLGGVKKIIPVKTKKKLKVISI